MHCYFVHVSYSTETEFLMSSVFSISPARARATVPPPLASADDLVSHRMKECCVQLHASVQKWKEVCQKGFDVSTKLVNTLQYEKHVHQACSLPGAHNSFLDAKIVEERESLYSHLNDVQHKLESIVKKMGILTGNVHTAVELLSASQDSCQAVFLTLTPHMFGLYFENVYKAYCEELSFRQTIVGDILKHSDLDTLTTYLSCWLHEPYIRAECKECLEGLLIDSSLR